NKQKEPLSEEYVALVEKLKSAFNSKVSFSRNDKGKGNITIPFSSDDELLTIMEVFDSIIDNKHGN
ncbi:MAG: chromosome partitioning protein ParB, partial [Paludibacteraceae bacterium]|nr:chromosome partitioning protein ParB [Paludibacteraceae bacterium]